MLEVTFDKKFFSHVFKTVRLLQTDRPHLFFIPILEQQFVYRVYRTQY